jgi:hypothetical protein
MNTNKHKYFEKKNKKVRGVRRWEGGKVRKLACLGTPDPWSLLKPPIQRIPDSCGKAGKLLIF